MSQTFQEFILSRSTIPSGTLVEHLNSWETGGTGPPPEPEIIYVPTYVNGSQYTVFYQDNTHNNTVEYVDYNNLEIKYKVETHNNTISYSLQYNKYLVKYEDQIIKVEYNGQS
jgi:hypothetical protein